MSLQACYMAAQADYEDVMRRFKNEEQVSRFLQMFLKDQSFEQLCAAMEEQDIEAAFNAVHTLKGVCLNLSLTALQKACVLLSDNLRSGEADSNTESYFNTTKQAYQETTLAINHYLANKERT